MDKATDQALLDASRAGDAQALETLLERFQPRIYRFGMRMCRDPEDASDVLQETLLAAARSIHDFRGGSSLSTWLYTIARSFCIKQRRRSKFAPAVEHSLDEAEASALESTTPNPEERAVSHELERALSHALGRLEPDHREVLLLRDGEGLTAPEVAKIVGISVDAVKSRLHRARAAVRATLAPLLGVPQPTPRVGCPDVVALFSRHLEGDITASVCSDMEATWPRAQAAAHLATRCDAPSRCAARPSRPPSLARSSARFAVPSRSSCRLRKTFEPSRRTPVSSAIERILCRAIGPHLVCSFAARAQLEVRDMFTNEGIVDRTIRVVFGAGLLLLAFFGPKTLWGLVGLVPLLTGVVGFCPLYRLLGMSTCVTTRKTAAAAHRSVT